jgi:AcrR family transcriptional regulator
MPEAQADSSTEARQQSVRAFKKSVILDSAQRVLERDGIEGATVRAIAKEAGYTPGALYAYYSNKDDILADLLCRSLGQAARAVRHHVEAGDQHTLHPTELATAFGAYYRQETGEFDLLLTVLQSQRARNLSPDIARTLNGRLIAALSPIADALEATGRWERQPASEATMQAAALGLGILVLENSGRLSALGMDGPSLTRSGFATLLS